MKEKTIIFKVTPKIKENLLIKVAIKNTTIKDYITNLIINDLKYDK